MIDQTVSQMPKIAIYNLTQLQEQNAYYQQLLREELDDLPPDEHPDIASVACIPTNRVSGCAIPPTYDGTNFKTNV